ncbi:hypothetical protein BDV10DRAFT_162509 [Aspergillus recurvatus]
MSRGESTVTGRMGMVDEFASACSMSFTISAFWVVCSRLHLVLFQILCFWCASNKEAHYIRFSTEPSAETLAGRQVTP